MRKVWIEQGSDIASEYYVGIAVDRELRQPVMMAARAEGFTAGLAVTTPPIQPGNVTVQASVTIVYEIAPRE